MAQFPYTSVDQLPTSLMPKLPMTLMLGQQTVEIVGLVDTGAAVNVLPYGVGLALGAIWEEQTVPVTLVGALGQFEARALVVMATNPQVTLEDPARLVFAWTRSQSAPVIFGQMNFFLEFDVCFYRSQALFDVRRKRSA